MKRREVYSICVFIALAGLTLMYFSSLYISLEQVDIEEIDRSWIGKNVKISGNVTEFRKSSGHAFFDVNDSTGEILVVDFESSLELEQGDTVNVTGHVEQYEGELEVIAREVQK